MKGNQTMKRRISLFVLLALTLALLCACGDKPSEPVSAEAQTTAADTTAAADDTTTAQDTETGGQPAEENYLCELEGYAVRMGADASVAIPALGEYSDLKEAPNCLYDGNDKCYSYSGFKVTTSPDGRGGEIVTAMEITSDEAAFQASGLTIGSTEADVTAAFGTPAENAFGVWKYDLPGASLSVVLDGDAVTSISVTYIAK